MAQAQRPGRTHSACLDYRMLAPILVPVALAQNANNAGLVRVVGNNGLLPKGPNVAKGRTVP